MQNQTVEVTPHHYTVRAYNKATGKVCGEFDCVRDAADFIKAQPLKHPQQPRFSHTLKLEPQYKYWVRSWKRYDCEPVPFKHNRVRWNEEFAYAPAAEWVIIDHLFQPVDRRSVELASYGYRYRDTNNGVKEALRESMQARLVRVKGSARKVKRGYEKVIRYWGGIFGGEHHYTSLRHAYYRAPQSQNERRTSCGHVDEYGEEMVRGRRRWNNLKDTYDDLNSVVYHTEKSWKHHSKRRKQWVPK